jgi:hypothetical protein
MRIENFQKLKRSDHSPKRDEFADVSSDPPYFSLDSPFKLQCKNQITFFTNMEGFELRAHVKLIDEKQKVKTLNYFPSFKDTAALIF